MTNEPTIVERPAQPYVGVRRSITLDTFNEVADRVPELIAWLDRQGIPPAEAPFFRYHVIDMERELQMEAGVPVASPLAGEGEIVPGTLPAGRYVTVTHVGHPEGLYDVTAQLLDWADKQGLTWDRADSPEGDRWGCRLEFYHTDPREQPDMNQWEIRLMVRLAD